jgi:hypothetical protein
VYPILPICNPIFQILSGKKYVARYVTNFDSTILLVVFSDFWV